MCLVTNQKKAKITIEDINVFKILFPNTRESYCTSFEYIKDVLYSASFGIRKINDLNTAEFWDDQANQYYRKKKYKTIFVISEGLHSFLTEKRADRKNGYSYFGEKVFPATIPKGAEYYVDGTGLIVSNKLIIH